MQHIRRRQRKFMSDMNVVPYIDVMLVLLVIFMITAPMMQTGIQVELPDVDAEPLISNNQREPLVISINEQGQYFLNDGSEITAISISNYVETYLDRNDKLPVYIKADKIVKYDFVMQAVAAIQQAGAKNIGLMANDTSTANKK